MKIAKGIELIEARDGTGTPARKGDRVVYNTRIFLNQGDAVRINDVLAAQLPPERKRMIDGQMLVDHHVELGKRHAIAGVERVLMGMKPGGYCKVRVSPHLAYRDKGVPGFIPANAVLVIEIWLRDVLERGA
jgi:FKBP-type peptidyl-prolyl cis-trans isomerase (trigger factor)